MVLPSVRQRIRFPNYPELPESLSCARPELVEGYRGSMRIISITKDQKVIKAR